MVNHLVTEPAKLITCPRCGQYTIHALSGGILVKANPEPLSVSQEITALLTGKRTYDLIPFGLHFYLEYRSAGRMESDRLHVVVATHTCQPTTTPPKLGPDMKLLIPAVSLPDEPPF